MFLAGRCTALPNEQPVLIDIQYGIRNIGTNTIVATANTKSIAEKLLSLYALNFPQNQYELVVVKEAHPNKL